MSKFVDSMIDEIREATSNEDFNSTLGLSEEEFVRFINEAIGRLHGKIVQQHTNVFLEEVELSTTRDDQNYDVPRRAFNKNSIHAVEYSPTGRSDDYYMLRPTTGRNRFPSVNGDPEFYIRRARELLLVPTPDTSVGTLRVTYVKKPKRLDKRRGLIKAVTTSGSTITNLEINYVNGSTVDSTELEKRTRMTVVDKYGTIKMDNILLQGITTSASYDATLTIDSSFAFESTETIAVGDYVVSGEYTTTHLDENDFDQYLEDYIREFARLRTLQRDSSNDSQEALGTLTAMEDQIVANFKDISDDIDTIPVINRDSTDSWWD